MIRPHLELEPVPANVPRTAAGLIACALSLLAGCGLQAAAPPEMAPDQLFVLVAPHEIRIFARPSETPRHIEFTFVRDRDADARKDVWRLHQLFEVRRMDDQSDRPFERAYGGAPIVTAGEWEFAAREVGARDFVGGFHGNEEVEGISLVADGRPVRLEEAQLVTRELTILLRTRLTSWHSGEKIARRTARYRFTRNGVDLRQAVTWLRDVELQNTYMTMLPIVRVIEGPPLVQVTDTARRLPGGDEEQVGLANFGQRRTTDTETVQIWSVISGITAEISMLERPQLPGYRAFISDAPAYNKVYFDITGSTTARAGDRWETFSRYRFSFDSLPEAAGD